MTDPDGARRALLTPAFWAMMALALLCILGGVAVVTFAHRPGHPGAGPFNSRPIQTRHSPGPP